MAITIPQMVSSTNKSSTNDIQFQKDELKGKKNAAKKAKSIGDLANASMGGRAAHFNLPKFSGKKIGPSFQEEVKSSNRTVREANKTTFPEAGVLLESIRKFKKETQGERLAPKQGVADTDSDVYFYEPVGTVGLVIKPGLIDARLSMMAQEVLKIVQLDHTVPSMQLGRLQEIESSQDKDKEYVIKQKHNGKEFAIEADTLILLTSDSLPEEGAIIKDPRSDSLFIIRDRQGNEEDKSVLVEVYNDIDMDDENFSDNENIDGGNRSMEESSSLEESWIDEFANTPFKLVQDADGSQFYLAPELAMHSVRVDKNSQKHVMRHNFPYDLKKKNEEDAYDIIGAEVPSLYQKKITPRFMGKGMDGLDVTKPSQERDAFYKRVNRESFIESFVSFMLTRSHDGKIERLKNDSNFLFEEMENGQLKIIQIDLDSVMPPSNKPKNNREPHPLRCGLMGFPMVDEKISGRELVHLEEVLGRCVTADNERDALKIIEMFGKEVSDVKGPSLMTRNRQKAYKEVVEGIRGFLKQNQSEATTLKSLFYHVFPSYRKHFELLVNPTDNVKAISPQLAALQVGAEPLNHYM